jgi:hypothetical protein
VVERSRRAHPEQTAEGGGMTFFEDGFTNESEDGFTNESKASEGGQS